MYWYVIRHPETGGVGIIGESALTVHKGQGWIRVSEAIPETERHGIDPAAYAEAPDLDAVDTRTLGSPPAEDNAEADITALADPEPKTTRKEK